jgi:hypothetical protein
MRFVSRRPSQAPSWRKLTGDVIPEERGEAAKAAEPPN